MKFDKKIVDEWVGGVEPSTIRRLLTLTPKQGERIKNGDYHGYEVVLMWAATNGDTVIKNELQAIVEHLALLRSQVAVLLGIPPALLTRALKGLPVKVVFANWIKAVARDSALLDLVSRRRL